MKILILIFALFLTLSASKIDTFAKEASYFRDYNSALEMAKKQNKTIMLVMVADFCPWCKKFERKSLRNKEISNFVKKNFIPVIVDNYRDKKHYPHRFETSKLPTVYFIDSDNQKVINSSSLYVKKNDFLEIIKKTIK